MPQAKTGGREKLTVRLKDNKKQKEPPRVLLHAGGLLEATPRFELGIRVLQTHALPLGYVAGFVSLV